VDALRTAAARTLATATRRLPVADQLAVAVCTVRSHLQALYQKTGAARKAALVRLVASLV
jgi:DNA-binding NarL/FixJ family response regulator